MTFARQYLILCDFCQTIFEQLFEVNGQSSLHTVEPQLSDPLLTNSFYYPKLSHAFSTFEGTMYGNSKHTFTYLNSRLSKRIVYLPHSFRYWFSTVHVIHRSMWLRFLLTAIREMVMLLWDWIRQSSSALESVKRWRLSAIKV